MGHFSNGTDGEMYQEKYCFRCVHWSDEFGCPVWFVHELHVGEADWKPTLDKLIPMEGLFSGKCYTFRDRAADGTGEPPLRPGQERGLEEWKAARPNYLLPRSGK